MPQIGQIRNFTMSPNVFLLFSLIKKKMNTATFRKMNEDSAPKLTSLTSCERVRTSGRMQEITPTISVPKKGVWYFGWIFAKTFGINVVSSHPVQHTGGRCLSGHGVCNTDGQDVDHQQRNSQAFSACRGSRVKETCGPVSIFPVRLDQGCYISLQYKYNCDRAKRNKNSFANGFFRADGFFRQPVLIPSKPRKDRHAMDVAEAMKFASTLPA